jgi:uncharacterized protein with HEPN domain
MASDELQDAVIRNVEVIGEAAKRVSADARRQLASLDWRAICGMRDVLIHEYIGVDLDEVWNVASSCMPERQAVLEQIWPVGDGARLPICPDISRCTQLRQGLALPSRGHTTAAAILKVSCSRSRNVLFVGPTWNG